MISIRTQHIFFFGKQTDRILVNFHTELDCDAGGGCAAAGAAAAGAAGGGSGRAAAGGSRAGSGRAVSAAVP